MTPRTPTTIVPALLLVLAGAAAAEDQALEQRIKNLESALEKVLADKNNAVQRSDIDAIQTDVENFKYQYQRDSETKRALSTRNLTIGGVIQVRGSYTDHNISTPVASDIAATSAKNPTVVHERRTTFDIPTVLLSFNGSLYRDYESARNLTYSASVVNAAQGDGTSYLNVLDANLTYQLLPTIESDGDRLSATFGQQLLPFGLESNTSEELKPVINNAQFVGGFGLGARQIGLIIKGEAFANYDFGYNYRQALVSYAFGIVNGNGSNVDDDNNYKDQIARVAFTVPADYDSWLRELRFGVSGYNGRSNLNQTPTTATSFVDTGPKRRFGFDVYYNHWPWGFTYEFVRGTDASLDASSKPTTTDKEGHTVTLFYSYGQQFLKSIKTQGKFDDWWPKTYQPFVRYDRWDPNRQTADDLNQVYTAGLNVFFAETTKAQINFNHRAQQVGKRSEAVESNEAVAQLQFGF